MRGRARDRIEIDAVVDLLRGDGARQRQQQTACDDNSATHRGLILVGATAGFRAMIVA
jgi:hypothetical protein